MKLKPAKPPPKPPKEWNPLNGLISAVYYLADVIQVHGENIMATTQELVDATAALVAAVTPLPQAINDLEAAITAAKGISPADQANIDAAFAAIQKVTTDIGAAVSDAQDGIDEAAPPKP